MFTKRQIDFLIFLLNQKGWVTGDELSDYFDLNKKIVRSEIKEIINIMGDEGNLLICHHQGYYLEYLSENIRKDVHMEVFQGGGKNSLRNRPAAFVLYLLFCDDYVSMQKMGDLFYLSKTAVSLELETVKRWVGRYEGVEIEASASKGIIIHGQEIKKRMYCAGFATIDVFNYMPLSKEIKAKYSYYTNIVKAILQEVLIEADYLITGEEFRKNNRFIVSSIIRSIMGYHIQEAESIRINNGFLSGPYEIDSVEHDIVLKLRDRIKQEIHYEIKDEELNSFHQMLQESNSLNHIYKKDLQLEESVALLEKEITVKLRLQNESLFTNPDIILEHFSKMKRRLYYGNVAINHYNDEIIKKYSLEVSLVYCLIPKYFGWRLTSEYSIIATFIGTELKKMKNRISILIVGNQSIGILNQIENILRQNTGMTITEIKVIPEYVFEKKQGISSKYDILLTTCQEILLMDHNFHIIPSVFSHKDMEDISRFLQTRYKEILNKRIQRIKNRYLVAEELDGGNDYINQLLYDNRYEESSYHTFGNGNIYIGIIASDIKTEIRIIKIKNPVRYKQKKIRRVIVASFNQKEEGILEFFSVISEILINIR